MNDFEKYIQSKKKQLELEEVNPEIWLSIENQILRKKQLRSKRILKWIQYAAAALLLGIIAIAGIKQGQSGNIDAQLLAVYGLQEYDFPKTIQMKTEGLSEAMIPADRQEDFAKLLKQLQFLDDQYQDYLQYIEQNGYQEFIGKQILYYYRTKIELLDKIQQEIEKINYYEKKFNQQNEKVELNI